MSEIELAVEKLNHRAFVILSLISEDSMQGGCHAYIINQRIDERGMRNWTQIGKSSIYDIMKKLENNNLIESYSKEVDGRLRKMYMVTHKGFKVLQKKIYKTIREFDGLNNPDYDIALSMYTIIPEDEQIEAFNKSLEVIERNFKMLKKQEDFSKNKAIKTWGMFPLSIEALFVRSYLIMEKHVEFIKWMIKRIPEEESLW